jgi:Uma2 family endonuclease
VYVAGNLFVYYEEGNPTACVAPDVFVVKSVTRHERRMYRLWEEHHPPAVVFEITSCRTRLDDLGTKRALYAMLGVPEYFVYDPLGEYLAPALQGYQLQDGEYQRLPHADGGRLVSQELGLELRLDAGRLRLVQPTTGEYLLTPAEAQEARRAAELRATQAEAELVQLRAELARLRREPG